MEKITVVVVEPKKEAYVKEINLDLESMQRIVGGYIESISPFNDDVYLVCNEEGKFGCVPNRMLVDDNGEIVDIIFGTFFICRAGEEDFDSLTDEQIEKYLSMYELPEDITFTQVN